MKTLAIAGAAVLAASLSALSAPTPAHAGKGMKIFGGGHFHRHHHHRRFHRPIIVTPVYVERRVVRPAPMVRQTPVAAMPTVRYADGLGRVYDSASGVWHGTVRTTAGPASLPGPSRAAPGSTAARAGIPPMGRG